VASTSLPYPIIGICHIQKANKNYGGIVENRNIGENDNIS
jgi:hypothetical protein